MKQFVVTARRAAFGWPFYITWNLIAHARDQEESIERAKIALIAIPFTIVTTAVWAAFWLAILVVFGWLMWQMVGYS